MDEISRQDDLPVLRVLGWVLFAAIATSVLLMTTLTPIPDNLPIQIMTAFMQVSSALFLVGVVWAPLGGWLCIRLAEPRSMRWIGLWGESALASAYFLLPWFHFVFVVLKRRIPAKMVLVGYFALLGLWLFGPGAFMLGSAWLWVSLEWDRGPAALIVVLPLSLIGPVVTFASWRKSIKMLLIAKSWTWDPAQGAARAIPSDYLAPYRLAIAAYVFAYAAGAITFLLFARWVYR